MRVFCDNTWPNRFCCWYPALCYHCRVLKNDDDSYAYVKWESLLFGKGCDPLYMASECCLPNYIQAIHQMQLLYMSFNPLKYDLGLVSWAYSVSAAHLGTHNRFSDAIRSSRCCPSRLYELVDRLIQDASYHYPNL